MYKLDSFDLKILELIQINNKITSEVLAKKVGLSSSACQRRINSMRKAKIIKKDISVIDQNVIGRQITIVVQVLSDKEGVEHYDEFKKLMLNAPEVMQCYYVTGDYDYVLIATFKDMGEYEIFTKKYFLENSKYEFNKRVNVYNNESDIKSFKLDYYSDTEKVFFYGPTVITGQDYRIFSENGFYNTKTKNGFFK